jgi:NitT/TauT family transport system substrate-binding protein
MRRAATKAERRTQPVGRRAVCAGLLAMAGVPCAWAAPEALTYLFPAPVFLPAFMPFHIAKARDYFGRNNVAIEFRTGRGGADVAQQVAVGNADLGGGVGETPIIVRANGLPVRAVAQLGRRSLFQLAVRKDAGVKSVAELRGRKLGVIGYQDSGYYALLALIATAGLKRADLEIQAVGPSGVTQLMLTRSLDGIMAVPEWADTIEAGGVPLDYFEVDASFPAMAQAILGSDRIIKERPAAVRGCVKAVLQAVNDCIADPTSATRDFVAAIPQWAGKEADMERILRRYVTNVYSGGDAAKPLGSFDPARIKTIQDFYVENKIVRTAVPVAELYTNEFVA